MDQNNIFNSKTDPIPEVRRDIEIIPVKNNGDSYLYFHDSLGYATPNFALDSKVATVLSLLDGRKSIQDLSPYLGEEVTGDQLLTYIQFLDENRLLHSSHFKAYSNQVEEKYEASDTHRSVTAGFSYPSDPVELESYLDEAFAKTGLHTDNEPESPKALYAPHIDPRVGMDSYVKAFSAIKDIKPKRVVILATSHYAGLYSDTYTNDPFIITDKDFELPLGTIRSDKARISRMLEEASGMGLTNQDRAHRIEHSIELHLLFLNYLWNHDYRVIPILVSGLEELFYMENGHRGNQVKAMGDLLNNHFAEDEETFFLISGDLAHVGKKFGDEQPAQQLFEKVKRFDEQFLESAEEANDQKIFNLIKEDHDPYRICGFPPLYTFLKSMKNIKGQAVSYDLWDEQEKESAVSFASIIYWNTDDTD